ncbi:MAG: class I SAM-dependent methyltransferase [Alphaproteobacteria bacterium]|nr:class I SAM-dependent methyltransferase [Alphaproteobacteria bacterium]OJV16060.1 MAG: hypothetical protein BGO27_04355 [Alphaproteobacteria bacterium 33-17]
MSTAIKHGDFTGLASNYSKYRPAYSEYVLDAIAGYLNKGTSINCADVGAGTGIWTRMLAKKFNNRIFAVEPNEDMRNHGINDSQATGVIWAEGTGENTNLPSDSFDLVSMASSFHWVDFQKGMQEFHRILKKDGCFVALWNPRVIEYNPLFIEIENYLNELNGNISRVSSGSSEFVDNLAKNFATLENFGDVLYLEGFHTQHFTKETYLGVWNSVNDIRHQLGEEKFEKFLNFINGLFPENEEIEVLYKTRAWIVRKK